MLENHRSLGVYILVLANAAYDDAYFDNATNTAEQINRCHRSKAAEIIIGGGVNSLNLACSGAKTATYTDGSEFKPGLDFYSSGGNQGLDVPYHALLSMDVRTYQPDNCPLCAQGVEVVKPGSRPGAASTTS